MSRAGRIAHEHHKNQHAQRAFGQTKAKMQPVGSDTLWIPEFLSSAQGIGPFNADSLIALPLGDTTEERTAKLRVASRVGVLHMYAYRVDGVFIEYRWEITETGTL